MIIYVCICRSSDAKVLAESLHPQLGGNADQVMRALMDRLVEIPEALPDGKRRIFSQRSQETGDFFGDLVAVCTGGYVSMDGTEHFFHVMNEKGVFYSCIADDTDMRRKQLNFDFLKALEVDFTKEFGSRRVANARELGLQKQFLPSIRSKMHYYNTNYEKLMRDEKVQILMDQIEDMKTIMDRNLRLVLRNQEIMAENMLHQSDMMRRDSQIFRRRSEILLQSQKRKRNAFYCFCFSFGIVVVYLFIAAGCGFNFSACRTSSSG